MSGLNDAVATTITLTAPGANDVTFTGKSESDGGPVSPLNNLKTTINPQGFNNLGGTDWDGGAFTLAADHEANKLEFEIGGVLSIPLTPSPYTNDNMGKYEASITLTVVETED